MVMSPDAGGIFDTLLRLVKLGLGGPAAGGRQYVSWVHEKDFIAAVQWIVDREHLAGPINIAAPNPLPYAEFMRALRRAAGVRIGLPATEWMLKVGAVVMRTDVELILKSRRVVATRLMNDGFQFSFREWDAAACDLVRRRRV
jgi:NAD dependent epimerase/dehydratase family enzyme